MKIFCTASKDTYITNKVISGRSKTEGNLGRAGTLDIFKLYDENNQLVDDGIEISRLLVKFDLERIKNLIDTRIDIKDESFDARIKLFDVNSGVPKPSKFNLEALPLNTNFDEGVGRDVAGYGDFDVANFINSSYTSGSNQPWKLQGANSKGIVGENVDVLIGMNTESGVHYFDSKQRFEMGDEDLSIDVTTVISGVLSGEIPDHGFRISFIEDQEQDDQTRLLKRFASRHVVNPQLRPRLEISFNDSIFDNRRNLILDQPNRLSLENKISGIRKNIIILDDELIGPDCIGLQISYGDMSLHFTGSQSSAGTFGNFIQGMYEAIVTIPSDSIINDEQGTLIYDELANLSKLELDERWYPLSNENRTIKRSKLTITNTDANLNGFGSLSYEFNLSNLRNQYQRGSIERITVFIYDPTIMHGPTRIKSLRLQSIILNDVHYSVRDANSGHVIMGYDFDKGSSKTSYDSNGLYFDIDMSSLIPGRTYAFDFCVLDGESQYHYRCSETFGVI
jgi:hypothetical protein